MKISTLEDVLDVIDNGSNLFIHGADATPKLFVKKLLQRCIDDRLSGISLYHLHTHGILDEEIHKLNGKVKFKCFFVGDNLRKHFDFETVDYIPCFLSEIPFLFANGNCPIDVCVIQVSPPDKHGYVTLGTSVDVTKSAVDHAKVVIAQINPNMPRVHGDGSVHVTEIDYFIESNEVLYSERCELITDDEMRIGELIASLIEDRSTIQCGIGNIPNAVLKSLTGHKDLGLHSEMWTNGAMDLIKSGVITNKFKQIMPGKSVAGFLVGDKELHEFVDDNENVLLRTSDYVNNPANVKLNDKTCAINSAVEIDLTGQICADSIGSRIISGVGGQMDFMRGAFLSKNGKAIIAINSRTRKGQSKIVSRLKYGSGVVTTRAHADYIVTENGIANLRGLSLNERAKALISISHPDEREKLYREWFAIKQLI
ncbi:acetyl-CoA hydrolase/transferase family protein [Halobacteriovorax sp.]|uniref:acetyl-CoA hydrolase/transferase family protein n=1 Tax=Halobacteriovorax sp. TaxID=2020862 RepID=UPI0035630B4D